MQQQQQQQQQQHRSTDILQVTRLLTQRRKLPGGVSTRTQDFPPGGEFLKVRYAVCHIRYPAGRGKFELRALGPGEKSA